MEVSFDNLVRKVSSKHKEEIEKFIADGFNRAAVFEDGNGVRRKIIGVDFPEGMEGPNVRAFSRGETVVNYEKDGKFYICSIAEWYEWFANSKEVAEEKPEEETVSDRLAKAQQRAHQRKATTVDFKPKGDGRKWRSNKPTKKSS